MASEYLFLEEVASEARVAVSTVRHWVGTGKLASIRPGRRRLVRRCDLEAFFTATTAAPTFREQRARQRREGR
jgi:excisionase family DNA binding protein